MGSESFFNKQTSLHFIVRNNYSNKKITIFGAPISPNGERDLLKLSGVSEADIKESLIKGDLANKLRLNVLEIISTNINLLQFDDEQKQFLIDHGANLGVNPTQIAKDTGKPYFEFSPLEDEPPPNSFFFDVDGAPSYTDENGDPHNIGSGGGIDGASVKANFLRNVNVIVPYDDADETEGETDEGTITLDIKPYQAIVQVTQNTLTINLPDSSGINNTIDIYAETGTAPVIINGSGISVQITGKDIRRYVYNGSIWEGDFLSETDWISAINAEALVDASNSLRQTLKFNYKRLNSVGHPFPEYNHGATTVGWAKSQFLRTVDMILSVDDTLNEGTNRTYTLDVKPYQSFINITKDNFVNVDLPRNPDVSNMVVDIYAESGAACIFVDMPYDDEGGTSQVVGGSDIRRFTHGDGGWNGSSLSEDDWINSVNKHALEKSGAINIFVGDDIELQGNYDGNVFVIGSASLTGDITVNGDLTITGVIDNDAGHAVQILGSVSAASIDFTLNPDAEGFIQQHGLEIDQDLVCGNFTFPVKVLTEEQENDESIGYPYVNIGGNIFCGGTFSGNGGNNAPGLDVTFYGSALINQLELKGGDATEDREAGGGGRLTVYGDFRCGGQIILNGGSTNFSQDASGAGVIDIYGSVYGGGWQLYGGTSTNTEGDSNIGSGSNGGSLTIRGNAFPQYIGANGGDCYSIDPTKSAGSGGEIHVYGDLHVGDSNNIDVSGGNRLGAISSAPEESASPPGGGDIRVDGNLTCLGGIINSKGGYSETTGYSVSMSGSGGTITVKGDLLFVGIDVSGGYSNLGDGGYSGNVTIYGDTLGYGDGEGAAIIANGGIGGNSQTDGTGGTGGNGGTLVFWGSCAAGIIAAGGNGWQGSGGTGGSIICHGSLNISAINTAGGNCNSTNAAHFAGSGGNIEAFNTLNCVAYVVTDGGSRTGATTEEVNNSSPNAGNIGVGSGNCYTSTVSMNGGSVSTTYNNGDGGMGGSLNVYNGALSNKTSITAKGGDSQGGNGGHGGYIFCDNGYISSPSVDLSGGASTNSPGNDAIGTAGGGGGLSIGSGGKINSFTAIDGATGNAFTVDGNDSDGGIRLGGNCTFDLINITDRNGLKIGPLSDNTTVTLATTVFIGKKSLSYSDEANHQTVDLDVADSINEGSIPTYRSSIFKYAGDTWFVITGTILGLAAP